LDPVRHRAKITGGAIGQCDGLERLAGNPKMIIGTTALLRVLHTTARPAQGMTSRAEMLAHRMVRITSGATPGMTHGTIVVLELRNSVP